MADVGRAEPGSRTPVARVEHWFVGDGSAASVLSFDVAAYAASALLAHAMRRGGAHQSYQMWGRVAAGPYAIAAVASAIALLGSVRRQIRARVTVVRCVIAFALLVVGLLLRRREKRT